MKTIINSTAATILILFSLMALNSSCTFIGLAIGYNIDKKEKDPYEVKPIEIKLIKQGKLLTLQCKDGRTMEGKYWGTSQISQEQFQEQYSAFKELHPNDLSLPAIGDTMEIYYTEFKTSEKCRFKALETDMIMVNQLNMDRTFNIPVTSNEIFIYHNGKPFIPNNYVNIPYLTTIQLEVTANNISSIPVNEIRILKVHYRKNARLTGSMIGLGIDAAIIIFIIWFGSTQVY